MVPTLRLVGTERIGNELSQSKVLGSEIGGAISAATSLEKGSRLKSLH